jgi:hypothetical protein
MSKDYVPTPDEWEEMLTEEGPLKWAAEAERVGVRAKEREELLHAMAIHLSDHARVLRRDGYHGLAGRMDDLLARYRALYPKEDGR